MTNLLSRKLIILTFTFALLSLIFGQKILANIILSDNDLSQSLNTKLANLYPEKGAGAVALIRKDGETLLKKAYGKVNIEFDINATVDSKFNIGSISKQMTAVLVLILMEEGKLSLDDNIAFYLPDYKQAKTNKITIRQLLGHVAGIPNFEGINGYTHHGTEHDSLDTIIKVFNDMPLDFQPGNQYSYSNSGFILLAKIIEKVSGQSFDEFIFQRIFKPVEMSETSFYDHKKLLSNFSKGYEISLDEPKKIVHAIAIKPTRGTGGIISTVTDLEKWFDALNSDQLISKATRQLAFTSQILADGEKSKYGFGLVTTNVGPYTTVEHGGNTHGAEGYMMWVAEKKLLIIVLSNLNRSYPGDLVVELAEQILDIPAAGSQRLALTAAQKARFVGSFRHKDDTVRQIFVEDGRLYSSRDNGHKHQLYPISSSQLVYQNFPRDSLMFIENSQGKFSEVKLAGRVSPTETAKRLILD